jgi:hypothetical protein
MDHFKVLPRNNQSNKSEKDLFTKPSALKQQGHLCHTIYQNLFQLAFKHMHHISYFYSKILLKSRVVLALENGR